MKKLILWVTVLPLFVRCASLSPQATNLTAPGSAESGEKSEPTIKRRIVVLRFSNSTGLGDDTVSNQGINLLKSAISEMPSCALLNSEEIDDYEKWVSDYRDFQYRSLFARARSRGVAAIIAGTVEDLSHDEAGDEVGIFRARTQTVRAQIRYRVFDVSSEKEIVTRLTDAESIEEHTRFLDSREPASWDDERGQVVISKAIQKNIPLLDKDLRRVSWTGRIAKIELSRYYISAGEASGLSKGQLLKVFGPGNTVSDPNGSFLGVAPGIFKGLLRIIDHFGEDGAIAVLHSGGGFREQDRIEVLTTPKE